MSTALDPTTGLTEGQQWKDFLAEVLPPQGAWSEEEYLLLTGSQNRLLEFTDGRLEALPMPTERHQRILKFLLFAFHFFLEPRGGYVLFAPLRLRIRPGKIREPDLLLFRSAQDPRRQDRFWTGADAVLEVVSPEYPDRDLIDKRKDYAEARIAEYWIVNPQTETITVLRLEGDAYVEAGVFRRGDTAASVLLAGFTVPVTAVFDAD